MNAKAPQKTPEGVENPTEQTPILPDATASAPVAESYEPKLLTMLPVGYKIHQPQGFIVRVPLVCPHCSSYMQVLASVRTMTCQTERCPHHLKKFKLPVLYAEEVKD